MLLLDVTIVNVALPAIQKDLHADFTDLQWVIDAYALMLASVLLVSGSIADIVGRRRIFVLGLGLFSAASLACGLATTPTFLTLARAVQGIGGAVLFATSLPLLAHAFPGKERATALGARGATIGGAGAVRPVPAGHPFQGKVRATASGVWGAAIGGAVAVGPLAGGVLTDSFGWQWIFFVNVPIGIVASFVPVAKVEESKDPSPTKVDWLGALTFSGALFTLVFALIRGNAEGWGSTTIVVLFVESALLMIAFIALELRAQQPMLDLSLFRKPAFAGASVAAFTLSAGMISLFLYIVLYIQNGLG